MAKKKMKQVHCIGMVGKSPSPQGMVMYYDTGKRISVADLAEILTILNQFPSLENQEDITEATKRLFELSNKFAKESGVYPVKFAGLAEDGRILVTEPYYDTPAEG